MNEIFSNKFDNIDGDTVPSPQCEIESQKQSMPVSVVDGLRQS